VNEEKKLERSREGPCNAAPSKRNRKAIDTKRTYRLRGGKWETEKENWKTSKQTSQKGKKGGATFSQEGSDRKTS